MNHVSGFSLAALLGVLLCAPLAHAATDDSTVEDAFDCRCDIDDGVGAASEVKKSDKPGMSSLWNFFEQKKSEVSSDARQDNAAWSSVAGFSTQCGMLREKFDKDSDGKLSAAEITGLQSAASEEFDAEAESKTGISKAEHQNIVTSAANLCNLLLPGKQAQPAKPAASVKESQPQSQSEKELAAVIEQLKAPVSSDMTDDGKDRHATALSKLLRDSDADGDGKYSADERKKLSEMLTTAQLAHMDALLSIFDLDADKLLGDGERASADGAIKSAYEQNIDKLIQKFDSDRDGTLSDAERDAAKLPALRCMCMMHKQDASGHSDTRALR
jgi:Ca2+-binding EF-hand superfamily protein